METYLKELVLAFQIYDCNIENVKCQRPLIRCLSDIVGDKKGPAITGPPCNPTWCDRNAFHPTGVSCCDADAAAVSVAGSLTGGGL